MSERRKTSWSLWCTIGFVLILTAYPLSAGPVSFLINSGLGELAFQIFGPDRVFDAVSVIYAPVTFLIGLCPEPVQIGFHSYVLWWVGLAVA